ncbi:helix-turn-helix transcriptional regulator [Idiomarina loihiensis]|uniref:helix-turn-helix transcriptional regulator n=1 Tax=Idiomarina loihiensis TaxID=135577 RepID=UPI00384D5350
MSKQGSRESMVRQWEMLKLLPTKPPGITASDICQHLNDQGFDISKRQVERNLNDLSQSFGITCNDKGQPFGWYWVSSADASLPAVSMAEALSLTMVEQVLKPILPATVFDALSPKLNQAKETLNKVNQRYKLASWQEKVAYVPATLPQIPPKVDEAILSQVQLAILKGQCIHVSYDSVDKRELRDYVLHPLGIVQRGLTTYITATIEPYQDVLLLAMHRIQALDVLDKPVAIPSDYKLSDYLNAGRLSFSSGESILVKAKISSETSLHVSETPLSQDQTIKKEGEHSILTATVADSWQLRWWLLSLCNDVEVLEPKSLRNEIKQQLAAASAKYQGA